HANGDKYEIAGWAERWSKEKRTGKERTAKWRENNKLRGSVTNGDARDVTESHRDACDALEETRREEIIPSAEGKKPRKAKEAARPLPADWLPSSEHSGLARERGVDLGLEARKFRAHADANDRRAVR